MSEKGPKNWDIPDIDERTPLLMRYPEPPHESLTTDEQELVAKYVESVAIESLAVRLKAATLGIQEVMKMRAESRGENNE